jgi:hypothetical protein
MNCFVWLGIGFQLLTNYKPESFVILQERKLYKGGICGTGQ